MTVSQIEVEAERAVTIKFILWSHLPDGTVKERPEEVFEFIYGIEHQVPTLESALRGASRGDRFDLIIPASEIYGDHDPGLVKEIPNTGLIKQRIKEGRYYRQMKKGCLVSFKVLEIRPDTVLADFNRPMAGISASMDVEILAVRKASKDEIGAAREGAFKKSIGCG